MVKNRKKRNDRNHILYRLTNLATGEQYIGLSAMIGQARLGTLKERFRRHLSRATHEAKGWAMHDAMRAWPHSKFWRKEVLEVVRGRKNAHQRERELIAEHNPKLNTF
jgi:hypothetical protein